MAANRAHGNPGPPLVAIEGIDGSGKTTLAAALTATLAGRGVSVASHHEPSNGPAGKLLRSLSADDDRHPMMLALLSAADRYDQQAWLTDQACDLVISDRYYLSGLAYHAADGIDQVLYQQLNAEVWRPDLYLFLDVAPEVAARRLRGRAGDRWERGGIAALVPAAYQSALRLVEATEDAKVIRLDAAAQPQEVLGQALSALTSLIIDPGGTSRV